LYQIGVFFNFAYYSGIYMIIAKNQGCFNFINLGDMPHRLGQMTQFAFSVGLLDFQFFGVEIYWVSPAPPWRDWVDWIHWVCEDRWEFRLFVVNPYR